ncbi:hypothetical protein POM88_054167 [Heracleum sosnowskyi]|uniref:Ribosomal protein S7 n=1 Tax=Heracleum sosnowskyi TaxID=360622 RepID=A0AAD8GP13_9APIA|nr:hypothetical protein POM88_054167 [Heracleum sosnowskyi]
MDVKSAFLNGELEEEVPILSDSRKIGDSASTKPGLVSDISVEDYITASAAKNPIYMPHTSGRYQAKRFRKALCPLVERLTNSLMMHGRNNGKKLLDVHIVKHAIEIIHLLTDQNPIQVIVDFVINSGRREDATRIGSAGVVRCQAVDISPLRRVNQAIYLLTTGARESAFRNVKTIAECLADELINAAKGSSNRLQCISCAITLSLFMCMTMIILFWSQLIICVILLSVSIAKAEDPYRYFTWTVTYGTDSPLGVPQQRPWNGIKQRKNSWQDGVLGTNCVIPPNSNYTYKFQTKDQIGGYTYFPSTLMYKAAGGFGALNIYARPRIPVPYSLPAGDFSLLIGDWRTSSHKIFRRLNFMPSFLAGLPKDYAICTGTTAFLAACATQTGKSHVDEVQGIVEFIQAAKRVKIS